MSVTVSRAVLETIEQIRDSGATNMFDRRTVQYIANQMDAYETVVWLEDHPSEYVEGIFSGFAVDGESNDF